MNLSNHPFTLMLGGHPQAISLLASMLETQTLSELFQQLLDSNIMDLVGSDEKQSYTSLRLSLEISINNISKTTPEAIELFKLIGLLPAGIEQESLTELYGSTNWKILKDHLIRASLLVYKPAENMLTLLPFMNTWAYELLEKEPIKKTEFHLKCCTFYKEYCIKFFEKMNNNKFSLSEFVNSEPNIWACIYRGIDRKKDNYEYDSEEESSEGYSDLMQTKTMGAFDMMALPDLIDNKPSSFKQKSSFNPKIRISETTEKRPSIIPEEEDDDDLVDDYDEMEDLDDELLAPQPKVIAQKTKSV